MEFYLPISVQANEALVTLEQHAEGANDSTGSVSRNGNQQTVEGISAEFAKDTYTVQMTSVN